jgi:hypothetical protein
MKDAARARVLAVTASLVTMMAVAGLGEDTAGPPRAYVDGTGPGWRTLGEDDFVPVNGEPDTWTWKDGVLHCTGMPVGVTRSRQPFTNFEFVASWRHLRSGGNSGFFVWTSEEALKDLPPGKLPRGGIEVQVLDIGFAEQYEKKTGK